MPRDVRLHLHDIATAIDRTLGYCSGMDRVAFEAHTRTVDAVCRSLEVLFFSTRLVGNKLFELPLTAELRRTI